MYSTLEELSSHPAFHYFAAISKILREDRLMKKRFATIWFTSIRIRPGGDPG